MYITKMVIPPIPSYTQHGSLCIPVLIPVLFHKAIVVVIVEDVCRKASRATKEARATCWRLCLKSLNFTSLFQTLYWPGNQHKHMKIYIYIYIHSVSLKLTITYYNYKLVSLYVFKVLATWRCQINRPNPPARLQEGDTHPKQSLNVWKSDHSQWQKSRDQK